MADRANLFQRLVRAALRFWSQTYRPPRRERPDDHTSRWRADHTPVLGSSTSVLKARRDKLAERFDPTVSRSFRLDLNLQPVAPLFVLVGIVQISATGGTGVRAGHGTDQAQIQFDTRLFVE
jgi:hypothetical protein